MENSPPIQSSTFPQQTDPFGGSFQGSEVITLNREAKILFQVNPLEDKENATIKLSLPFGLEYTRGGLQWQGNLAKGRVVSLEAYVKTSNRMQGNIKAEVSSPGTSPGVIESRSYYFEVSTLDGNSATSDAIEVK